MGYPQGFCVKAGMTTILFFQNLPVTFKNANIEIPATRFKNNSLAKIADKIRSGDKIK